MPASASRSGADPSPETASAWPRYSSVRPLAADEVHVWLARLDLRPEHLGALAQTLDGQERARAARFAYEIHRARFTAARGTLRALLGAYLDMAPAAVRLAYGSRGKPRMADGGASGLHFNVAHTGDAALVAVSLGRDVGADIERERDVDHAHVGARMFSPAEHAALLAMPPARRRAAFFECWAYKESYVKAHGDGLSIDTTRFDAWRPEHREGTRAVVRGAEVDGHWEVVALAPMLEHPAAVCARGSGWRVRHAEWVA